MEFTHLWCSFRQRRRTCQSTCPNSSLLSNNLTAPFVHFRILCNSTKDHRPTLFEYESNSPLFYPTTTIDPPIKMVSYTGFLISSSAEIHLQNEVTSRYIYTIPFYDSSYWLFHSKRSLVILTQLQFPAFFTRLASIFGPLYEQHGTPMLEAACHNIATWYVFIILAPILLF